VLVEKHISGNMRENPGGGTAFLAPPSANAYAVQRYNRPIFNLLNIGRYANSNKFTMIRDAR